MSDDPDLEAAYALDGPDAVKALYRAWADSFDQGFLAETGYIYHQHLIRLFVRRFQSAANGDDSILDVGCGTGVGGVELRRYGSWPVDGLDLSPEMLAQAATKVESGQPVYRNLFEADLLQPLAIADGVYDGLVSIGTFTHGHVGPEAVDELVRVVRPNGVICLGVNEEFFTQANFGVHLQRLQDTGAISRVETQQVRIYDASSAPHAHIDDTALVLTFSPGPSSDSAPETEDRRF